MVVRIIVWCNVRMLTHNYVRIKMLSLNSDDGFMDTTTVTSKFLSNGTGLQDNSCMQKALSHVFSQNGILSHCTSQDDSNLAHEWLGQVAGGT